MSAATKPSLFFIVGEASGDVIGASLLHALKKKNVGPECWAGVGGPAMEGEGFQSQHDMNALCVMGLFEVIKHIPRLRRLILDMVHRIEKAQPDILITIDLPDFNFRVAQRLKKRGIFKGKIIHYVAPTVWAWRPGRAKKVAQFLDGMICLFPFEPSYFEEHGLSSVFAGHPLVEKQVENANGDAFRDKYGIGSKKKLLGVLFGSRSAELKNVGPVLVQAIQSLKERIGDFEIICPTLPHLSGVVADLTKGLGVPVHITSNSEQKWNAFKACDAAVAVSGTVGLELAYAGVPHVIAYKMNGLTWRLMQKLVKTRYAHLANIILDRPAIPEFLQDEAQADKIAESLEDLLNNPEQQKLDLKAHLQNVEKSPSECAADFILEQL